MKTINNFFYNLNLKLKNIQILSNYNIKIIAIIIMIIEHFIKINIFAIIDYYKFIGNADFGYYLQEITRIHIYKITAISFPLFCFLLVEGFKYTKNKKKHMLTMLIFAFISEIPFDIAFFGGLSFYKFYFNIFYFGYQNVFFTLFLGLVSIYFIEKIDNNNFSSLKTNLLKILNISIICIIATLINCDYQYEGILLISLFYITRNNRIYQSFIYILVFCLLRNEQPNIYNIIFCIIILLYNGKLYNKIKIKHNFKYIFYWIYPLHITLFLFVRLFLENYITKQ